MPTRRLSQARLQVCNDLFDLLIFVKFIQECGLLFEELQQPYTHAQSEEPGYLNRFSKLYESHFEALCTALDAEVFSPIEYY